jgi:hypothetical protein
MSAARYCKRLPVKVITKDIASEFRKFEHRNQNKAHNIMLKRGKFIPAVTRFSEK